MKLQLYAEVAVKGRRAWARLAIKELEEPMENRRVGLRVGGTPLEATEVNQQEVDPTRITSERGSPLKGIAEVASSSTIVE